MDKDNPAVFECPKTKSGLHHWQRRDLGGAWCIKCDLELNKYHAHQVFADHGK